MSNRLAAETSPYLRQHAENPVDWYPWGDEAFSRARGEGKPVLLSVGYSACHWCHVMAHESFENAAIAALMNELFINIKVDREERPDVDTVYMQAVQGMTGRGGWPMTVFLAPDGVPFYGGTYFPPDDRAGMPGFPRVLRAAADAYRTRREEITAAGARMPDVLAPPRLVSRGEPEIGQVDAAAEMVVAQTDRRHGGFGDAPKFPHPMALDLMLRRYRVRRDPEVWDAASLSLEAMARGGIYDQLGGGFHRYSVDGRWAVPHFEKMLYDNAQLVPPYLHAYQLSGRQDFRRVVEQTLHYLEREMLLPRGGFAASQDADTAEGEGAYFVWTPDSLRVALGDEDGIFAARVFGVTEDGNFEQGATVLSLPRRLADVAAADQVALPDLLARLDSVRARLLEARGRRAAPGRDDKVITSWNALTVQAFAETGAALGEQRLVDVARQVSDFLLDALVVDGAVYRSWKEGSARVVGFLEDVAHLANALFSVYEATGEPRFFHSARAMCELIVREYRDDDGSYFDTSRSAEQLIVRPRTLEDNPLMSGQAAAASAFLRLAAFSGEDMWRVRAMEIIEPLAPAVARAPLALAGLGLAMEFALQQVREVAIIGDADDERTHALLRCVQERFDPLRVLAWGTMDEAIPLLHCRSMVNGVPAAYVCERFVCAAPVTEAAELERQLEPGDDDAGHGVSAEVVGDVDPMR